MRISKFTLGSKLLWFSFDFDFLDEPWLGIGIFLLVIVASAVPMGFHVVWCIQMAAENGSAIALLVAGLLIAPVGWAHGMSILLGFGGWV